MNTCITFYSVRNRAWASSKVDGSDVAHSFRENATIFLDWQVETVHIYLMMAWSWMSITVYEACTLVCHSSWASPAFRKTVACVGCWLASPQFISWTTPTSWMHATDSRCADRREIWKIPWRILDILALLVMQAGWFRINVQTLNLVHHHQHHRD